MSERVTNHSLQPVTLDDGTVIAANGTDGSEKVVTLSDGDRKRYVRPGMLVVIGTDSEAATAGAGQPQPAQPAPESNTRRKENK